MITKRMVKKGYKMGVVRLIESPHEDGVVCCIGDNWFYFGGLTAEKETVASYKSYVPENQIIDDIFSVLDEFRNIPENCDEYSYYESIFSENGILPVELVQFHCMDNLDKCNGSIQLGRNQDLAYGKFRKNQKDLEIILKVTEEIAVTYQENTYHNPSEFPDELKSRILSNPHACAYTSGRSECGHPKLGIGIQKYFSYLASAAGCMAKNMVFEASFGTASADNILHDMYDVAEQCYEQMECESSKIPATTIEIETYINGDGIPEVYISDKTGSGIHYPVNSLSDVGIRIVQYLSDITYENYLQKLKLAYLKDDVPAVGWLDSVLSNTSDELHGMAMELSDDELTGFLAWAGDDDWYCKDKSLLQK